MNTVGVRTARGAARREALIAAAFELVAAEGLAGFRLRPVAVAAGLDDSSLHHYFASREALVAAVVEELVSRLRRLLPTRAEPGTAGLYRHLRELGAWMGTEPALFAVLREMDVLAGREPGVAAAMDQAEAEWRAGVERLVAAVPAQAGADHRVVATAVIAAVKGVGLSRVNAEAVLSALATALGSTDDTIAEGGRADG